MIALIQEKLPRYVDAKPFEIQVLTPMRKGLLGVERLNQILQRYLNPPEDGKSERAVGDRLFRTGDKVMQIRNNYQMEWEIRGRYGVVIEKGVGVFNGDTGILREINEFAETAEVEFEDGRLQCTRSNSWRNWNLHMLLQSTSLRDLSIRQSYFHCFPDHRCF